MKTPPTTPELCYVRSDLFSGVTTAIESGLEYARQCLSEHDASLGRTTRKNRVWAETIEADIAQMEAVLNALPTCR